MGGGSDGLDTGFCGGAGGVPVGFFVGAAGFVPAVRPLVVAVRPGSGASDGIVGGGSMSDGRAASADGAPLKLAAVVLWAGGNRATAVPPTASTPAVVRVAISHGRRRESGSVTGTPLPHYPPSSMGR
ncbi:hypothetical protein GCM10010172_17450 [Paractinoplanes ferrugineus]